MPLEGFVSALGLGEMLAGDLFMTQIGVLAATAFLFLGSLALSVLSFRSAAASRRALGHAHDLASEMRQLTAQIELSARAPSSAPDRYEGTAEHAGGALHSIDLTENDRAEHAHAETRLEAAKKAAIEPSALLRGRLRRR